MPGPSVDSLPFSSAHIADIFGQRAFARGLSCKSKGAVLRVTVELPEKTIRGNVQDTRDLPFSTRVTFNEKGFINSAYCSCRVINYCEHAVALLLEAGGIYGFKEEIDSIEVPKNVQHWVDDLKGSIAEHAERITEKPRGESIIYIIDRSRFGVPSLELAPHVVGKKNNAGFQKVMPAAFEDFSPEMGANKEDESIAQFALAVLNSSYLGDVLSGEPELMQRLLDKVIATGRAHFRSASNPRLTKGPRHEGKVKWVFRRDRSQVPTIVGERESIIPVLSACPAYVDTFMWHFGFMDLPVEVETIAKLLTAPPVMPGFAEKVHEQLRSMHLPPDIELPCPMMGEEIIKTEPKPQLSFKNITPIGNESLAYWRYGFEPNKGVNVVDVSFDYGGHIFDLRGKQMEHREAKGDSTVVFLRDLKAEKQILWQLNELGFEALPMQKESSQMRFVLKQDSDWRWLHFIENELPHILQRDWSIDIEDSFSYRIITPEEAMEFDLTEKTAWWFVLELGVNHGGERISLFPIIVSAIKRAGVRFENLDISMLNRNGYFYAPMPDGRIIKLPFDRVKSVIELVGELFSFDMGLGGISPADLSDVLKTHIRIMPTDRIKKLAKQLDKLKTVEPIDTPENFGTELRDYQKEGLGWLNFLTDMDAGGVLADDMGLGKTVQGLAHILLRKQKGLLTSPALVVCPTSVVSNWINEAERLTPDLKVLRLTGPDRAHNYTKILQYDIVVTSYALLVRDEESLCQSEWSIVILDESQYIKNPVTTIAKAAYKLRARSRFCFTGTPVENNLRELWSQFNFVMPNMLGNRKSYTNYFQKPIEHNSDSERARILRKRIRPFLLRRTKSEVAQELPPKTLILQPVELVGEQRDLYESVRLAMHKRVNEELREKGITGMRILIIDALLKLRQTCCDPRLVKLKMADGITDSAKLLTLMDMVPQLVQEGRKILIFSQFRKMLELIEVELQREGLNYAMLTGVTKDRQSEINKFQNGKVPIFLISLKAGGTGLNLTAADTVIHYDPWWNPAVEDQATDRAYRIGQDKPVFVYKFIAKGSVEERIVVMQEHKKGLAGGIFTEGKSGSLAVDQDEIDFLLQPLDMPDPKLLRRKSPPSLHIVE